MTRLARLALTAATIAAALPFASAAELDKNALYKHLKKVFSAPPGVEFEIKDLKPSKLPGFKSGILEIRFKGRTQTQPMSISDDGHYYVMAEPIPVGESKIPGLVGTPEGDPELPQIHLTKDGKQLIIGEFRDLTVDPDAANMAKLNIKGSPFQGKAGAPLVFVEFTDLECPYCQVAHAALSADLLKTYEGKIQWVLKHNPLTSIHPWAYDAAIAAACAHKLKADAAWKISDKYYSKQDELNPGNMKEKSIAFAKEVGLDEKKFATCYEKKETQAIVDADIGEARALGINSTPTFVINGRVQAGFRDFATMKELLDDLLAEKMAEKKEKAN